MYMANIKIALNYRGISHFYCTTDKLHEEFLKSNLAGQVVQYSRYLIAPVTLV